MKTLKLSIILFIFSSYSITSLAQNCYVELTDVSGFNTTQYQGGLETAACKLIESMPDTIQNQFGIYDYGFYSLTNSMYGNYQPIRDKVVSEVTTPYYLIFGKKSDNTGIYTEFLIDIKLPESWLGVCFDDSYIQMLKTSIIFNFGQIDYSKNPSTYASYEIACMEYLEERFLELSECCQPFLRSESSCDGCISLLNVDDFFKSNGFDSISIEVLNPDTSIIEECLCESESTSVVNRIGNNSRSSGFLLDMTHGYNVLLNGSEINISNKGNKIIEIYQNAYGLVTHSINYCQEDFYTLLSGFDASEVSFWIHVSDNKLYFKRKGIGDKIIVGDCNQDHLEQLNCILNKFESSGANIFEEIMQEFDSSKKDVILNVDCPPDANDAHGQTIDELLGRLGILEIFINPELFESIEDYPLKPAETLIHEMCHGLISLNVLKGNGASSCTWLNYNYYYAQYGNNEGSADECIIAKYFIDKQAKLLWLYNDKHLEEKHYLISAWGAYFEIYSGCKSNVNYTLSEISDWYIEMRDSNPNTFPYTSN